MKYLWIGIGGFFGAVGRYSLSSLMNHWLREPWFPYGTLACNVLGCFLIGYLAGLAEYRQVFPAYIRMLVFIGLLGGFTTFSSFGLETVHLIRESQFVSAILNIIISVAAGIAAVMLGLSLSK